MLSVQSAGCAGMERLGVPVRTSISSPSDDRGHISRRMRVDNIQSRDMIVRDTDRQIRNNHHHFHNRSGCAGSGVRGIDNNCSGVLGASTIPVQCSEKNKTLIPQQQQYHQKTQNVIRCPHHVPLPDSEWGQDRDLQIRPRYQSSELIRSYITPPPNKTVLDVPEQSFNLYTSTGISCNLGANYNNLQQYYQPHNNNNNHNSYQHQQHQQAQQQKSKPNVIQKLFSRKSSPKSPQPSPTLLSSSSSSCSSVASTSSSSTSTSSLNCTTALPISAASTLTATNCNLGTNIGPPPIIHHTLSSQQQQQILQQSTSLPIGSVQIPILSSATTTHQTIDNDDVELAIEATPSATKSQSLAADILTATNKSDNNATISTNPSIASSSSSSSTSSTTTIVTNLTAATSLQLCKSKSCTLSQISLASTASSTSSMGSLSPHSIDCCYVQATNVRPSVPKTPNNDCNNSSGKQQHNDYV